MKPQDETKWRFRSPDIIGPVLCIALTVVAYFIGLRPPIRQRSESLLQEAQANRQRRRTSELDRTLRDAKARLQAVQQSIAETPLQLKREEHMISHLAALAGLASESHLEIEETQLGETVDTSRCKMTPIQISAEGDQAACALFLHRLSQNFPDTAVFAMEISAATKQPDSPVNFQVDLIWRFAPDQRQGGSPAGTEITR